MNRRETIHTNAGAFTIPRARRESFSIPSSNMKLLKSDDEAFVRVEWVLSSSSVDRDGDFFDPKGLTLAPHVNVVDTHGMGNPGINSILGVVEQGSLRVKGKNATGVLRIGGTNPNAQIAKGMIEDGILGNGSIRFDPFHYIETVENMEGDKIEREVRRKRGDPRRYAFGPRNIKEAEVLEFSLLAVPSNPDSRERMAKAYGVDLNPPLPLEIVTVGAAAGKTEIKRDEWGEFWTPDPDAGEGDWGGFFK